jgi:two-component system sensor histidine kinase RegB
VWPILMFDCRVVAGATIDARILFTIRWVAVVGQTAALLFTELILGLPLPLVPALFVVSLSVLLNLWLIRQAQRHQPSDKYNLMVLGFDVVQLAALLYLTGGLLNPFSVMILAPVVVSAAVLRRQSTLVLIGLVAASVSFLLLFNLPLDWQADFAVPADYRAGVWLALVLTSCFLGGYVWWVASSARHLSGALADANLALVEEQQTRALGTLATAAAHKLGSPLNTITVIGHELARDISPDDPIYDDIQLLRAEIERCRVILGELDVVQGRRAIAEEPPLPIDRLVDEVIFQRLKQDETRFSITHMDGGGALPLVVPRPELLHALENLLQNAMQFSRSAVDVHIEWTGDHLHISITDDGPGFTASVLARAGQPWNSARAGEGGHRGLGLFIAKSLIHSIGGVVTFGNSRQAGATIIITVPRSALG